MTTNRLKTVVRSKVTGKITISYTMSSALANLFSEETKKKYQRAIKPKEFDAKKKPTLDEKGRVKVSKKQKRLESESNGEEVKKKKPKHKHSGKSSNSDTDNSSGVWTEQLRQDDEDTTIFVGNIPLSADVKSLKKYFKEFGEIESIRLRSVPIAGAAVDDHGNQDLVKKVCTNSRKFGDQKGSFNAYMP